MSDSTGNSALLRKLRVHQIARWLEVHPYEVVRTLVQADALPPDLRLDTADVERVRTAAGLETWWEPGGVPASDEELLAVLVQRLLARITRGSAPTRSDNLFRGLDPQRQVFLRRAVNQLVRLGYLDIVMTASGLCVTLRPEREAELRLLVVGATELADIVESAGLK